MIGRLGHRVIEKAGSSRRRAAHSILSHIPWEIVAVDFDARPLTSFAASLVSLGPRDAGCEYRGAKTPFCTCSSALARHSNSCVTAGIPFPARTGGQKLSVFPKLVLPHPHVFSLPGKPASLGHCFRAANLVC